MASHINIEQGWQHKINGVCCIEMCKHDIIGNRIYGRHIIAKGNIIEGIEARD